MSLNSFIATLPDRKYFKEGDATLSWNVWSDKNADRLRIISKLEDPWRLDKLLILPRWTQSRGDRSDYVTRLDLRVLPIEPEKQYEPQPCKAQVIREVVKSYFPHTIEPVLLFAAFPLAGDYSVPRWLIYSFVVEVEATDEAPEMALKVEPSSAVPAQSRALRGLSAVPAKQSPKLSASDAGKVGGAAATNEKTDNETRIQEALDTVSEAVDALKKVHDWDKLKVREKIKLIQAETERLRGVRVSTQTLYRKWMKPLW